MWGHRASAKRERAVSLCPHEGCIHEGGLGCFAGGGVMPGEGASSYLAGVCGVLGFSANDLWVRPRLDARFLSRSSVTLMAASPTSHSTVMQTPERGRYRGLLNLFMLKLFVILFGGGGRRGGAHPRGARSGYS